MLGFYAYQRHKAMRLHFMENNSYDFFTYNGKTRVSEDKFNRDRSKWQYAALERDYEEPELTSILFVGTRNFPYASFNKRKYVRAYQQRCKEITHFVSVQYGEDLEKIRLYCEETGYKIHELFTARDGLIHPPIYMLYLDNEISIETVKVIDLFVHDFINMSASNDEFHWKEFVMQHLLERKFGQMLMAEHRGRITKSFVRLLEMEKNQTQHNIQR